MLKSRNAVAIAATLMLSTSINCMAASADDKPVVKLTAASPAALSAPKVVAKKSWWQKAFPCCGEDAVKVRDSLVVVGALAQVGLQIAGNIVTDPKAKQAINATGTGISAIGQAANQASTGDADGAIDAAQTIIGAGLNIATEFTDTSTDHILNVTNGVVGAAAHQAHQVAAGTRNGAEAIVDVTNTALNAAAGLTSGEASTALHTVAAVIDGISAATTQSPQ